MRVGSGAVLAAVALAATWAGGFAFSLLWLAAGIAIAAEWIAMVRAEPRLPLVVAVAAGLVALFVVSRTGAGALPAALVLGAVAAVVALLAQDTSGRLWAATAFLGSAVVTLVPSIVRDHPDLGLTVILWMFAVVWTTDILAYFTGRALGGPRLWPQVSPKKTWSGVLGGLVGAALAGTAVAGLAPSFGAEPPVGIAATAVLSVLASVASQAGDLAESALKRHFRVKDSSRLIPGHGGFMDRLDGFAAVACLVGLALAGSRLAAR